VTGESKKANHEETGHGVEIGEGRKGERRGAFILPLGQGCISTVKHYGEKIGRNGGDIGARGSRI
jgi:hypothetical protein